MGGFGVYLLHHGLQTQLIQVQPIHNLLFDTPFSLIVMHTNYATLLLSAICAEQKAGCLTGLHQSCNVATLLHTRLPTLCFVKASVSS